MDKASEIRELKKLLDDNIISDDEFKTQKRKILGIDIDEHENTPHEKHESESHEQSVKEKLQNYENKIINEVTIVDPKTETKEHSSDIKHVHHNIVNSEDDISAIREEVLSGFVDDHKTSNDAITTESITDNSSKDDFYDREKIKHLARLEAEEEIKARKKTASITAINKGMSSGIRVLKWILAVLLWIFGVFAMIGQTKFSYIIAAIVLIIEGCFACPKLTDYISEKYQVFYKYKTVFVILGVILFFAAVSFGGRTS